MTVRTVKCKLCGLPLTGAEQFIGHMVHTHEIRLEEAAYTWEVMKSGSVQLQLNQDEVRD